MRLFNTISKKKEKFIPLSKKEVGLYTCGPTVYHYVHIGNLRSYIFEDVLKRALLFNGYKVNHIMNITDVGHLTSDADSGEDKMLKGAKREKKTVWEIAEFYTSSFLDDIKKLHIIPPTKLTKATEHIKEQIEMIQKLQEKGFTYTAGGNVYFNTSKFKDYGNLTNLQIDEQARVESDPNKKNKHDFVLWFTKSKFSKQAMKWESVFGTGYPGWHIECSAMASKYLGDQFDIHCGGMDLIPVHHTNEIAQAQAAFGKSPWVKYWLHNEFVVLPKGDKMSKSEDNFLTLSLLEKKGFDPMDYRYFCLTAVYRKPITFSWAALESARNSRKKLFEKVMELKSSSHGNDNGALRKKYLGDFTTGLNDDLNMPKSLAVMWELLKDEKLSGHDKYLLLLEFDKVLGFNLGAIKEDKVPSEIKKLADQRLAARNMKDWKKSDELREKIIQLGWEISDTKGRYNLKKS